MCWDYQDKWALISWYKILLYRLFRRESYQWYLAHTTGRKCILYLDMSLDEDISSTFYNDGSARYCLGVHASISVPILIERIEDFASLVLFSPLFSGELLTVKQALVNFPVELRVREAYIWASSSSRCLRCCFNFSRSWSYMGDQQCKLNEEVAEIHTSFTFSCWRT